MYSIPPIKQLLIFAVLILSSQNLWSRDVVRSGDAFFLDIVNYNNKSLSVVDERFNIELPDSSLINIADKSVSQIKQDIHQYLDGDYNLRKIEYIKKNKLINITILGDINYPGNYLTKKNSDLSLINKYNGLYDETAFDSSIILIRHGKRTAINPGNYDSYQTQPSDIFLVTLMQKKTSIISKQASMTPEIKTSVKPDKPEFALQGSEQATQVVIKKQNTPAQTSPASTPPKAEAKVKIPAVKEKKQVKPPLSEKIKPDKNAHPQDNKMQKLPDLRKTPSEVYKLQPGDILSIGLPSEEGFNTDFLIDREGNITLPEIGQLTIAGTSIDNAARTIHHRLSDVFLGLDKLSVHLKEKRLLITVLGYVTKPGEVDLPSNGNVQMAINEAGGLESGAQMDKLQLQRNGKIIEFDFKKYLDTGNNQLVPKLQSLDVIFVPSSPELGSIHGEKGMLDANGIDPIKDRDSIKVFGEVVKPTSIPFQEKITLVDALLKAGGVTRFGNVEQIRVINNGRPTLFNLKSFLDTGDQSQLQLLSKGATIFIPKQVEAVQGGGRIVYVMGQVQKPGSFETGNNVTFLDVLANAGGPNRYADTRAVRILRANGETVPFNLQEYAEGRGDVLPDIFPGDAIFFPEKNPDEDQGWLTLTSDKSIQMVGAIKRPDRYEWSENVTFMDLLGHAGGPTEKADLAHIKIISSGPDGKTVTRIFDMEKFIEGGGSWSQMPKLTGGSTIIFPDLPRDPSDNKAQWVKVPKEEAIYMMGAVNSPGRYSFNNKMDLLDIISAADGPSKDADLSKIRIVHRGEGAPRTSHVSLVDYFETGDESLLPKVRTGDSIYIPSIERSWTEKKKEDTVRILGAVTTSGRYDFNNDMTVLDLLAEAGGPTTTAYVEKIIIVNTSCCKNQAYTFDLMDFMKDPDTSKLPVLRAGDTIYVPDTSMSYWAMFMEAVKDSLSVISLVSIITGF